MQWLQLRLDTNASLAPSCEEVLLELGAAAVTLQDNADQPLFDQGLVEPPLWQETRVTGLFPAGTDIQSLWQALPEDIRQGCQYRAEILEDKDWEREWMRNYQAIQFAPSLWICPSWQTPPDPGAVNIMLDPGLAFGTGTHPTTAMCLGLLAERDLRECELLDYGCGSGVLAIAGLLLGAPSAFGVDTDHLALVASRNNAERNGINQDRFELAPPGALPGDLRAGLVIANILAGPLCELAPTLRQHMGRGAELILSGILQEQAEHLRNAYREQGITLEEAAEKEGWIALAGHRR